MPEFEQRKRKTMSRQELYDEYLSGESGSPKKAAGKKSQSKKTAKGNGGHRRENPHVSEEAKKRQMELRQKQTAAKESKTYTGKTSGKSPKSRSDSYSSHRSSKTASRTSSDSQRTSAGGRGYSKAGRSHKNQKKKAGRYTLYYVLIGILAVAALTVLSTTVLFNIGVFVVSGETVYSDEEIIAACGIAKGENLLRINASRAEDKIVSELVYIDSAKIHRGFPNRLTISVEAAKPAVAFAYGGKYYVISENKRLLEISDKPLNCPVVKGVQIILQPKEEKKTETAEGDVTTDISVPTGEEGITLENGAQEIGVGAVLGDDAEGRIRLALSIAKYMAESGLEKSYEMNIADILGIKIDYGGHIRIDLGTTASLEDKIYNASRIIEEDVAENENCTLNLTNPNRGVKRPVYENGDNGTAAEKPEATEATEDTQTQPPEAEP